MFVKTLSLVMSETEIALKEAEFQSLMYIAAVGVLLPSAFDKLLHSVVVGIALVTATHVCAWVLFHK